MLYKFKSPAAGDLIMLEPNGRRVLDIIGKAPGPSGIILPEQMGAAIQALEAAVSAEDAAQQANAADNSTPDAVPPKADAVTLRQRAVPFIEMLKRCQKAEKEIVWGV